MGSFADQLADFQRQYEQRIQDIHLGRVIETQRSVQEGSEITGAPGQPVDTGALRASWIVEHIRPLVSQTTTGLEYAEPIEEGIGPHGPITLRSTVGGFHSVGLTILGNQAIAEYVTKQQKPIVLRYSLDARRRA